MSLPPTQPNNKSFWPSWPSFFSPQRSEGVFTKVQSVFQAFQAVSAIRGSYQIIERHYIILTESVTKITTGQADNSALKTVACYVGGIIIVTFICLKISKAFAGPAALVVIYYSVRQPPPHPHYPPPPPPLHSQTPSHSATETARSTSEERAVPLDMNSQANGATTFSMPSITPSSTSISEANTQRQTSEDDIHAQLQPQKDTDDPIIHRKQQETLNVNNTPISGSGIHNDLSTVVQISKDPEETTDDPTIQPETQGLSTTPKDESALQSSSNPGYPLINQYPYPTIISMPVPLSNLAPNSLEEMSRKSPGPIESPKSDPEKQTQQGAFDYSPTSMLEQEIDEEGSELSSLSSKGPLSTIESPRSAVITQTEGFKDITIDQSPITAHPEILSPQPDSSAPDPFTNPAQKQIEEEPLHKETETQLASISLSPLQQASEIRKKIKIEMQKAIKMLLNQSEMFTTTLIQEIRYPLPQSFRQTGQEKIKHFLELSKTLMGTLMQMDHTSDKQEKALDEAYKKESYPLFTLKFLVQHFQLLQKFIEYQNNMASDLQLPQDQAYKEEPLGKHAKTVEKERAKPGMASEEIPPPRNIKDLLGSSAMLTAMLMKKGSDRYSIQTFTSAFQKTIEQCLEISKALLALSIKQLNTSLPIQKEPLSETYQKGPADTFILKFTIQHLQLLQKFKEHENLIITPQSRL